MVPHHFFGAEEIWLGDARVRMFDRERALLDCFALPRRFGGIAGSFLVAELAARQLGFSEIFMVVAAPAVIAAIALLVKQAAHPETRTEHRVAVDAAH